MHKLIALVSVLFLLFGCCQLAAGAQSDDAHRIEAVRAAAPIHIDGALDEAAWRNAPIATDFIQNEPREGEPASERTEVRVLYDDAYLYIGVSAHDSSPNDIIVNELKKDFDPLATDLFEVILDTFHDGRNGY